MHARIGSLERSTPATACWARDRAGSFHVPGQLFRAQGNGKSAGSALPRTCPACGTDYSHRKPGSGPLSPLRSFRTGFAKASQLLATEVFSLLNVSGSAAKSIVFSDSRQDAARAALDIERRHHQDMRRQLLLSEIGNAARRKASGPDIPTLEREIEVAAKARRFQDADRLQRQLDGLARGADPSRVPLSLILEPDETRDPTIAPLMRRHVDLGVHPSDPAGIDEINGRPWYRWIDDAAGAEPRWRGTDGFTDAGRAKVLARGGSTTTHLRTPLLEELLRPGGDGTRVSVADPRPGSGVGSARRVPARAR